MVHEQGKRKTKMDLDFQAITETLSQNQTNSKAGMRSSVEKRCKNMGGGCGFVERRGSTGVRCVRGRWVNIVSPHYMCVQDCQRMSEKIKILFRGISLEIYKSNLEQRQAILQ